MRPKLLPNPVKINLSMDRSTKRKAFKLATEKGISISQLVVQFIERESNGKPARTEGGK